MALALALLPLMLCGGGARAADENGNFLILGVGATSCWKFQADSTNVIYVAWLTGFLTAIDLTTPRVRNILSGTDIDGAMVGSTTTASKIQHKPFLKRLEN